MFLGGLLRKRTGYHFQVKMVLEMGSILVQAVKRW